MQLDLGKFPSQGGVIEQISAMTDKSRFTRSAGDIWLYSIRTPAYGVVIRLYDMHAAYILYSRGIQC